MKPSINQIQEEIKRQGVPPEKVIELLGLSTHKLLQSFPQSIREYDLSILEYLGFDVEEYKEYREEVETYSGHVKDLKRAALSEIDVSLKADVSEDVVEEGGEQDGQEEQEQKDR